MRFSAFKSPVYERAVLKRIFSVVFSLFDLILEVIMLNVENAQKGTVSRHW